MAGHDLAFDGNFHSMEWHRPSPPDLDVEICATGPDANVTQHRCNAVARPGNRAIDAFGSD